VGHFPEFQLNGIASGEKFRLDPIGWFREIPGNLFTASSLEVGGQLTHLHTNYRQVSNANIPSVAATNNICHKNRKAKVS